jgi:hypothetical protein
MAINQLLKRMSDFYPTSPSGDLLTCAKHLFVAAMVSLARISGLGAHRVGKFTVLVTS